MALEIERKYLVNKTLWEKIKPESGNAIKQCYLFAGESGSGRVRVKGKKAYLTIKGKAEGISRSEFEYEIPLDDAEEMMRLFPTQTVEKIRYEVKVNGKLWEVDEFSGKNAGLLMAEIELNSVDDVFDLPEWAGQEVTHDLRYNNSRLAVYPFCEW
jgi:adenylate cyclase